jgi:hypothetical protein
LKFPNFLSFLLVLELYQLYLMLNFVVEFGFRRRLVVPRSATLHLGC